MRSVFSTGASLCGQIALVAVMYEGPDAGDITNLCGEQGPDFGSILRGHENSITL